MPTEELIKRAFRYDSHTGYLHFSDDKKITGRVRPDRRAGTLLPNGYRRVFFMGKQYTEHRVIWLIVYGSWPVGEIDHINFVRDDNRLSNLRDVSRLKNANMRQKRGDVWFDANYNGPKKWRAAIRFRGKRTLLGYFRTEAEARDVVAAYYIDNPEISALREII